MSAQELSSRAIRGHFFKTLAQDTGAAWIPGISMASNSDQDSEDYKWLGQSPALREWVGGRHAKGVWDNGINIKNKHYEATLKILVKDLRRDKTPQTLLRVAELARRTNSHWASLLSILIELGTSTVCYDGQWFYDTDHTEGNNSTSQSNDVTTDISALPAAVHGSTTAPSPEEIQQAVMLSIAQILSFKDNENEPMNEDASNFLVMVPTSLFIPFNNALTMPAGTAVSEQKKPSKFNIDLEINARLTATDAFHTFRTDGSVKPFIRQQETAVQLGQKAEGSEYEFDNSAHQYGVDTWRNVGFGYWQHACYNQMT